jgi:hypothetical protein
MYRITYEEFLKGLRIYKLMFKINRIIKILGINMICNYKIIVKFSKSLSHHSLVSL